MKIRHPTTPAQPDFPDLLTDEQSQALADRRRCEMMNQHVIDRLRWQYNSFCILDLRGYAVQGDMWRCVCALRREVEGVTS